MQTTRDKIREEKKIKRLVVKKQQIFLNSQSSSQHISKFSVIFYMHHSHTKGVFHNSASLK